MQYLYVALCGETLEYCTALLSLSLQDLSDVLDSVVILTAGYLNSDQFEIEFNEIRDTVLYVVNSSLTTISDFDVIDFVNQVCLFVCLLSILVYSNDYSCLLPVDNSRLQLSPTRGRHTQSSECLCF